MMSPGANNEINTPSCVWRPPTHTNPTPPNERFNERTHEAHPSSSSDAAGLRQWKFAVASLRRPAVLPSAAAAGPAQGAYPASELRKPTALPKLFSLSFSLPLSALCSLFPSSGHASGHPFFSCVGKSPLLQSALRSPGCPNPPLHCCKLQPAQQPPASRPEQGSQLVARGLLRVTSPVIWDWQRAGSSHVRGPVHKARMDQSLGRLIACRQQPEPLLHAASRGTSQYTRVIPCCLQLPGVGD